MTHSATPGATDATRAHDLVKEWGEALLDAERGVAISASEADLNSVGAFVAHAVPRLRSRVDIRDAEASAVFSFRLPRNPFGEFVNARSVVLGSS